MPPSTTSLRVRYAETDQMGVAYYANYFIWAEIGRVELLRQLGFEYRRWSSSTTAIFPSLKPPAATNRRLATTT